MVNSKEKTVSVKYIVYDRLKAKMIGGERHFPVYTQIVYEGKNIRFKTKVLGKPIFVSEFF